MQYEWDEVKRQRNIRKHRIDFADVKEVLGTEILTYIDSRYDYGEERYISFGFLKGKPTIVVYT